jgi:hypothetical protein
LRLDPRDIQRFGDEEDDFDYSEDKRPDTEPVEREMSFPFAAVDSGALIVADVAHLPRLVTLLTWEPYESSLCRAAPTRSRPDGYDTGR